MRFAERMAGIGTETAFEVLAKARQLEARGRSVIHLEIGEPDFDTPPNIQQAGIDALREGFTHYTPAGGILKAREAVAEYVRHAHGVEVAPEGVVLVPGSKNVLLFTILALINPGDEVIVPDPGYPIYASLANFVGGRSASSSSTPRRIRRAGSSCAPTWKRSRSWPSSTTWSCSRTRSIRKSSTKGSISRSSPSPA